MPSVFLKDRSLLRVGGSEAAVFLHNLITTDVVSMSIDEARPGGLLTPQGKILFDFMIWREGDDFILETSIGQRDGLIKRLTMYKLRAAVEIEPIPEGGVTVSWDMDAPRESVKDSRFATAGIALFRRKGPHGADSEALYEVLRIANGIAVSERDFELQDAFPHDVLMDLNGGLSFRKGCYVGQEVISRMQHRGTARRRIVIVASESDLPATGTVITAEGKSLGMIGSVAGTRGLAILRIDRAGEAMANGTPILAGNSAVSLALPAWSGLTFPSSADEATA